MSTAKFVVGQELMHVAAENVRLFVVSVLSETCPGGTQHHYYCRAVVTNAISTELIKVNEVELRSSTVAERRIDCLAAASRWMHERKDTATNAKDCELALDWRLAADALRSAIKKEQDHECRKEIE